MFSVSFQKEWWNVIGHINSFSSILTRDFKQKQKQKQKTNKQTKQNFD